MAEPIPSNPHFRVPFSFGPYGARMVEQGSLDDHAQQVEALMRTGIGQRGDMPDYGVPDGVFEQNGPQQRIIMAALARWAPDVNVETSIRMIDKLTYQIHNEVKGNPSV